jgi:hypothetical protein
MLAKAASMSRPEATSPNQNFPPAGRRLGIVQGRIALGIGRVHQHGYSLCRRHQLVQKLHALSHQLGGEEVDAGDIAAGSIEAGYEPLLHRVATHGENDGDRGGRCLGRERRGRAARCDDHAHFAPHEIGGQFGEPPVLALRPVELERDVLVDVVAALGEAFAESGHLRRPLGGRAGVDEADHRHRRLLRARRERPRDRRAADERDELAPS